MFLISGSLFVFVVVSIITYSKLNYYLFLFLLLSPFVLYIISSYSPSSLYSFPILISDNVSILLLYTTLFLILTSLVSVDTLPSPQSHPSQTPSSLLYSLFLLFASSFVVFSTSNIILLYIFYEASLVPISFIILKWGVYPDRGYSGLIMLLFTSVFTFPLSILLLYLNLSGSFNYFYLLSDSFSYSVLLSFWVLLSFSVNLPLYGVHFWLPIAHVEAPTFGSIILAGLLLNMGGCGLIRLYPLFISSLSSLGVFISSYLFFSVLISSILTSIQSDFKRLVAYSSVVHITILIILILVINPINYGVFLMLMVFHAYSSPVLFYLVGVLYNLLSTRQLFLLRGIVYSTPLLAFFIVLVFLVNVPVPPIPPFLSEVFFFVGVYTYSLWFIILPLILIIVVIVYSLSWLVGSLSSPSTPTSFTHPSYRSFLVLTTYVSTTLLFSFLIFLF